MTSDSEHDIPEDDSEKLRREERAGDETIQDDVPPEDGADSPEDQAGDQTVLFDEDEQSSREGQPTGDGERTIVDEELFGSPRDEGQKTVIDFPEDGPSTEEPDSANATFVSESGASAESGDPTEGRSDHQGTIDENQTYVEEQDDPDNAKTIVEDSHADNFDLSKTWGIDLQDVTDPGMTIRGTEAHVSSAQEGHQLPRRELAHDRQKAEGRSEYDLLKVLGEGGMGIVWEARQRSIERNVAIKMIKSRAAAKPRQVEKFIAEAVVTGDLEHPNIVPIHELGKDAEGNCFYAMKQVQGTPWNKVIREKSLHENLDYLIDTCDAIAFAHARGIMHRDLKPENIMLGEYGEVLVMDWGLALPTEDFSKRNLISQSQGMGGTPAYMAPEMATGPLNRVTYASDIYLLGAILYEIISGYPPHRGKTSQECLAAAMRNRITDIDQHNELTEIAYKAMAMDPADRYGSVKEFQAAIRDYLSHEKSLTLSARANQELQKASSTDSYENYARSVFGFEEAITLWSENEEAREGLHSAKIAYATTALQKQDFDLAESLIESDRADHQELLTRIRGAKQDRIARRRMLKVAKGAVAALVVAILLITGTSYYLVNEEFQRAVQAEREATRQRNNAVEEKREADFQRKIANQERDKAEENRIAAVEARREAEEREEEATEQRRIAEEQRVAAEQARRAEQYKSYVASIGLAAAKVEENAFEDALSLLLSCPPELRNWEWGRLMYLCSQSSDRFHCEAPVDGLALSPDQNRLASASWDGKLRLWDLETNETTQTLDHEGIYVHAVDWSPEGNLIATGSDDPGGRLKLWNPRTGKLIGKYPAHENAIVGVRFSSNGRWLTTCSFDNTARLWRVGENGQVEPVCTLKGHTWWVWEAEFIPGFDPASADKNRIVTVSQDGKAIVWAIRENQQESSEERPPAVTAEPLVEYLAHDGPVYCVDFHPSGQSVATGGYDKTIQYWKPDQIKPFDFEAAVRGENIERQQHVRFAEHTGPVRSVQFSEAGDLVVSGSQDNSLKIWDLTEESAIKTFRGHDSAVRSCVIARDGRNLYSSSEDESIIHWSVDDYAEFQTLNGRELQGHRDAILAARFSPDGDHVLTASRDRSARLWNIANGQAEVAFQEGHRYLSSSARFLDEEQFLATSAADNSVRIWNTATGTELMQYPNTGRSGLIAISDDESRMATGSEDERILIWDLSAIQQDPTPRLMAELSGHQHPVTALHFVPGTHELLSGDAHGRMIKWDTDQKSILWSQRSHTLKISGLQVAGSPPVVLAASYDHTVGVHHLDTGEEDVERVLKHAGPVVAMARSGNGKRIISTSIAEKAENSTAAESRLSVWSLPLESDSSGEIEPEFSHELYGFSINDLETTSDGEIAYLTCSDNTVKRMDLETGAWENVLEGAEHGGLLWASRLSADGQRLLTIGGVDARLWELATGKERMSFGPHGAVAAIAMHPDGKTVITGSWDRSLKFWDTRSGKSQRKIPEAHPAYINSVAFSHSGDKFVSAGDDGVLIVWDHETARELTRIEKNKAGINLAVFSPDDQTILSASRDRSLKLWNAETGELVREFPKEHSWSVLAAAFSPDGSRVVSGSEDNTAILWETETGQVLAQLKGHTAAVTSVEFSGDGQRILTASRDNTAKLWDASRGNEGNEILTLSKHKQEVTAVDFSANSLNALTASRDGTAIVWPAIDWKNFKLDPENAEFVSGQSE